VNRNAPVFEPGSELLGSDDYGRRDIDQDMAERRHVEETRAQCNRDPEELPGLAARDGYGPKTAERQRRDLETKSRR